MRMDRLTGRAAVITGGASGIGLASALAFAQDGASVALVDRDVHALERAAKQFATTPLLLDGDVGDEAVVTAHAVAVQQQFGRLDILMACAGWSAGLSVADSDLTSWEAVLRTNLTGSFLWSRAAIPLMRAIGGGAIILVGLDSSPSPAGVRMPPISRPRGRSLASRAAWRSTTPRKAFA